MKSSIHRGSGNEGAGSANGQGTMAKWTAQPADGSTPLPAHNSPLTDQESLELEQSEKIIKNGWKSFVKVGQALMKIQKNKLYRGGYATFEHYCRDRLEISRPYAYNLIGSAEVLEDLSSIEDIPSKPVNEAQTRCLIALPKEKRIAAWKKAVEKAGADPVTAKLVREVVVKYKQKKVVQAGSDNSAKKSRIDKSTVFSVQRMIEEAEEALNAKDFSKAQKILQQMRETLSPKAPAAVNTSNPTAALESV
jgi:hypothetical protein